MLEDTTQKTQVMGSGSAHWKTRPNNDIGTVSTQDKTTMEEWATLERGKVTVAGDRHVKSSTATTVSTESSKQTGNSSNVHTQSDILEQQTDPTSSPSEMLDEPDRKDTESPIDSDRAVYGSNSVHSDSSDSSTEHGDSKKNMTTAVGLEKVGGQFDESCSGREAASFHNPANDVEAKYINDKVIKANSEHFTLHVWPLFTDDMMQLQRRTSSFIPKYISEIPEPRFKSPRDPKSPPNRLLTRMATSATREKYISHQSLCCTWT